MNDSSVSLVVGHGHKPGCVLIMGWPGPLGSEADHLVSAPLTTDRRPAAHLRVNHTGPPPLLHGLV